MQSLDAAPFRGRKISLTASIRVEGGGHAQLFLRVLRPGGQLAFYDDMGDRPVASAEWRAAEIAGEVAPDAESIEIGLLSFGQAAVWIDDVQLRPGAAPTGAETAARREIEALYARIDAAYTRGDIAEMARLALPDAQIVLPQAARLWPPRSMGSPPNSERGRKCSRAPPSPA